jgi:hypothetical protein
VSCGGGEQLKVGGGGGASGRRVSVCYGGAAGG